MGRPQNPPGTATLTIIVIPRVRGWLEELADHGVYGKTATAVAEHFILEGVNQELRGDGLLKNPPPMPRAREEDDLEKR
jgi:hypothetical protein